VSKRFDKIS